MLQIIDNIKERVVKNKFLVGLVLWLAFLGPSCNRKTESTADNHVVRCAVIGGMTMTGLWQQIAKMLVVS